jgi:hypothetical protein
MDLPKAYEVGYFYANPHYAQGYTDYGQILGSWVVRKGIGAQASTTRWFSPQTKASFFYRKMVSEVAFLGGGSNSDYGANGMWRIRPEMESNALLEYERWKFPVLQETPRSHFTGSIEFRVYPSPGWHSQETK